MNKGIVIIIIYFLFVSLTDKRRENEPYVDFDFIHKKIIGDTSFFKKKYKAKFKIKNGELESLYFTLDGAKKFFIKKESDSGTYYYNNLDAFHNRGLFKMVHYTTCKFYYKTNDTIYIKHYNYVSPMMLEEPIEWHSLIFEKNSNIYEYECDSNYKIYDLKSYSFYEYSNKNWFFLWHY